jgi:hypothetical protein
VTRCTGDAAVAREAAIVEQPPPKLYFAGGDRILLRDRHIEVESERNHERQREQPDH